MEKEGNGGNTGDHQSSTLSKFLKGENFFSERDAVAKTRNMRLSQKISNDRVASVTNLSGTSTMTASLTANNQDRTA
jgi:hypothetical protein